MKLEIAAWRRELRRQLGPDRKCVPKIVFGAWLPAALCLLFAPGIRADELKPKATPAQQAFLEGQDAFIAGHLAEAEADFQRSLRLDPRHVNAMLGLAEIRLTKGDSTGAGVYFQKAVATKPDDPTVQTDWGHYLFFRKQYAEALKALDMATHIDPKAAKPYFEKGDVYLVGLNQPEDAIRAYRAGIAIDSSQAKSHYGLAMALAKAGHTSDAEVEFKAAVRLEPNNPTMLQALAVFFASQRRYDEALDKYADALKAQPAFFPANFGRGDVFMATGKFDNAIDEYRAALKIVPKSADAYFKIGIADERQSRLDDADRAFLFAVSLDPKEVAAYNELAWIAASRRQDLDRAVGWITKAIALAPRDANLRDTEAWVYRARGENQKAIEGLQKSLELEPKNPEALYHLGVIYSEMGRTEKARESLTSALALKMDFSDQADAKKRLGSLQQ